MGTNVCLISKNLYQLEHAYEQAQRDQIPCELIIDQGHIMPPHFTGDPIVTALGIGPVHRCDIKHITKRFKLLK